MSSAIQYDLPADLHVHSQWSWDADQGDMRATCERALAIGLPAIAFSDHADFTPWRAHRSPGDPPGIRIPVSRSHRGDLDLEAYWDSIDSCRHDFPQLRILASVELGEPHLFTAEVARVLGFRAHDRVLGSQHCIERNGHLIDVSSPDLLTPASASEVFRAHLDSTLRLVESSAPFTVLAHLDYAKRYWPHDELPFREEQFEDEYRAVLRALVRSGRVLEINTNRARDPLRAPNPSLAAVRWWYEEGGAAVSFGSDAHSAQDLAADFTGTAEMVIAAGFRRPHDPAGFWPR